MRLRLFLRIIFVFLCGLSVANAAPEVTASLSSQSIAVGESVDLEVTVGGTTRAENPGVPQIDGLDYLGSGQSSQTVFNNGNVTQRVTFTHRFVGRKEGTFTIPAMTVTVGGESATTQPLTLTVKAGAPMKAAGDIAFAVIEPLETTAFVGQDIGVKMRAYLETNTEWRNVDKPALSSEGFNTRDIKPGSQAQIDVNGKRYHTVDYRTVVTPTKAGKLKLGEMKLRVLYSKTQSNRYDPFGRIMGRAEEMTITAPAVEIEVKPLPVAGRPKDFAGAIGNFKFTGTGSPAKVKIGEPVTMALVVQGQGNFDRITVPPLAEPDGWTAYDSEDSFTPSDDLGITGQKSFKLPVSPNAPKTTIPVFAFSFFDPKEEKYVTLKNEATPLTVEGTPAAPPPVPTAGAAPTPVPVEAKPELLPNLPSPGANASFRPALSPSFVFGAILVPLPILIALVALRSRKADPLAGPLGALARERADVLSKLRRTEDRAELFEAAGRILQIDTAIARREPGLAFDDATVLATRQLDDSALASVKALMAQRTELLFAGGGRGEKASSVERDRVLEALAAWERSRVEVKAASMARVAVCILFALASAANAGDFEDANKAFAEGKFQDARRGYERALSDGWKPNVLVNLGNAHYRLEQPGRAVLNFERALALAPGQPDAAANLKFVRDQSGGRAPEPRWYESALGVLSPRVAPWFAIGVAWLGWLWAGAAILRRWGAGGVVGGTFLVLLGAAFGAGLIWNGEQRANDAVVIEKTDARREPADRASLSEALGAGGRVRILSEQGEWTFVGLPGGQKGWLKSAAVERIIPPKYR